jgi:hypothetical protein
MRMAPAWMLNTTGVILMDMSVEVDVMVEVLTSVSLLDVNGPGREAGVKMSGLDNPATGVIHRLLTSCPD